MINKYKKFDVSVKGLMNSINIQSRRNQSFTDDDGF